MDLKNIKEVFIKQKMEQKIIIPKNSKAYINNYVLADNKRTYVLEEGAELMLNDYIVGPVHSEVHIVHNNNSKSNVYSKLLNLNGRSTVIGTIEIPEKTSAEGHLVQKALRFKGRIIQQPNLIINHNDVKASHSSSIEDIDYDALFYLQTRAIEKEQAEFLIIKGFLNSNNKQFNNIVYDRIKKALSH